MSCSCQDDCGVLLCITQGADKFVSYRYKVDDVYQSFTGLTPIVAQIRSKAGGDLYLDIAPYFTVRVGAPTYLDLEIPGSATATLTKDGEYDIFVGGIRLVGGLVEVKLRVSV